ncbi:MAG: hypothetical protein DI637_09285 [Citromicrobium sp.]|nr:MAG: hypothetical protein DI637_09285 [Citromicrobium sp.]
MTPDEARDALGSIDQTKEKMAQRMRWPLWRHAAFGFVLALLLAGIVLSTQWQAVLYAIVIVMVFFIIRDDRKRHGMYVSGYQKGRTIWVLIGIAMGFMTAIFAMNSWVDDGIADPLFWLLTGAIFVFSTAMSYVWQFVYQKDLRRGAA